MSLWPSGPPKTAPIPLVPETETEELAPTVLPKNTDISYVPSIEVSEPIPETDTEELKPTTED